jgi:Zn-dependent M28 family amino/carboxypeptidase
MRLAHPRTRSGPRRTGTRLVTLIALTLTVFVRADPAHADASSILQQVSQDNIAAHISALSFERVTAAQQAAATDYIEAQLQSFGYEVSRIPVQDSANLVASLTGTVNPDQVLIIGAHFDTWSNTPGADDNASGVAGNLEIARVLAGSTFESTVQFVFFALEEIGLAGSTDYAESAAAAGTNITGMIALEMIGYTCGTPGCQTPFNDFLPCLDVEPEGEDVGTYIAIVANTASTGLLTEYQSGAAFVVPTLEQGAAIVAGTGTCFGDSRRSDHAPFWDEGYPALMITDTANYRNPNYHQPTDTPETLDLPFATDVVRATLIFAMIHATWLSGPAPAVAVLPGWALLVLGLMVVTAVAGTSGLWGAGGRSES